MMGKRILVVERDKDILDLITTILEGKGFIVSQSRTETAIVDRVIKEKPDAIILDIIKPTPEGTALCDDIKKTKSIKHIPVIVLSTYPNIKSSKVECADEIISKPFDIDELIDEIEKQVVA